MDFTEEQMRGAIRMMIKHLYKNQKEAAENLGIKQPNLSVAMAGDPVPRALYEHFGFEKVVIYRLGVEDENAGS